MSGGIPDDESQATVFQPQEIVEVSSHLSSRLVVRIDLPPLYFGHLLGERGLLNAPRNPEILLDALALARLLLDLLQERGNDVRAPLFGDLAPGDAVDDDKRGGPFLAGWRYSK